MNKKNKKRVLIIDDEPDNTTVFKIALEDSGFDVDTYNDPTVSLYTLKPDLYDLVILDVNMPYMTGYELYEKLKQIDNKVKVCFLTASVEGYNEERSEQFISVDCSPSYQYPSDTPHITKPIKMDDLVRTVFEMIKW
jgi:two-component system, OmpR family, response regulator ChvI